MSNNSPDPLFTVKEAAAYLRMPETSFREKYRARKIGYIKTGKRIVFRQSELERYLAENTLPAKVVF